MSVDGLSRVIASSTSVLAPVSDCGAKLVAQLSATLMCKDGMIELADRVYWIVPLAIAGVIVARKYGYLTGRVTPPDLSPINLERISIDLSTSSSDTEDDVSGSDTELTDPENSDEDSIEDLSRMAGDIADDVGMDLVAFDQAGNLGELHEEVEHLVQRLDQQGRMLDQIDQMELMREHLEQRLGQVWEQMEQVREQMEQRWERIEQRVELIERQQRDSTKTKQSR